MIVLECKKVKFYSDIDELLFFEWIKRIPCVKSSHGRKSSILIDIKSKKISQHDLLELIALFYKYRVNMKQLDVFLTDQNDSWFKVKGRYWYKRIFSDKK